MYDVFAKYVKGEIPFLPWCEVPLQAETTTISSDLVAINKAGFLTINSQVRLGSGQGEDEEAGECAYGHSCLLGLLPVLHVTLHAIAALQPQPGP